MSCSAAGRGTPSRVREWVPNTQKWIVWGDKHADKSRDFIRKGHLGREQGKGIQENCCALWLAISSFMVTGLAFRLSLAHHSDSGSFLNACIAQPRWIPARRILGGCRICGISSHFLNSPGCWWLVSSVLLTRTSYPKITHANGY